MAKGLDQGRAFLAGVLGKITDPGQKTLVEQMLANELIVTEIGNGVAGQSEIDRQLQTLTAQAKDLETRAASLDQREQTLETWHGNLQAWHQEHKALVDEAVAARAGGGGGGAGAGAGGGKKPTDQPPAGLTEEQFKAQLAEERGAFLGFSRDQNQITREHFTKFGEIVELEPLLRHPQIRDLGLTGVYELVHKERLDKFKVDADKKREDAIRADERQKTLGEQAQMPYPSPTGVGSGSPLDALTVGKPDSVATAATDHYNRLQRERTGAPA